MKNKFSRKSLLLVSMTVILATVINLFAGVVAFADDATTTDVIEIESADELKKIGGDTNYPVNGNYKLVENITLSEEWTPLPKFSGVFDGNGHTISGLQIIKTYENTDSDPQIGLFEALNGTGVVKNLTLASVYIDATVSASSKKVRLDVGAIAGGSSNTASVSNCKVSGTIKVTQTVVGSQNGRTRIGGILGFAQDKVEYCKSNIAFIVTSNNANSDYKTWCYVGGIVGQSVSSVAYCINNGAVSVSATGIYPAYAGGICGTNATWDGNAVAVQNCVNNGDVSATYTIENTNKPAVGAGGILGYISTNNTGATLKNNFNFGTIESSGSKGQIVGHKVTAPTGSGNCGVDNQGSLVGNVADSEAFGTTASEETMLINQPTLGTQVVGYQTSDAVEGNFNLRLVATMEGGYKNLTNVGFTVSASYGNVTKDEQTFTIKTLYSSISAEANTKAEKEYTAEELGGDYIFVLACKNLPENVGYITFTVTTFYTDANGTHSNMVQTFTVNSDDIPSANMPEAAA